jgi:uncharacterized membrane protein
MIAAGIATVVAAVVALFAPWQLTVLVWWDVAALVTLGSVWGSVARFTPEETAEFAMQEDDSRAGTQLTLLGAAVVSLVGVVAAFLKANQSDRSQELLLEGTGVATIACSWALVHTVFALRYAHLYYTPPKGGIDFKMEPEPDYRDFAYTAFTVGMTFQVSDTDIQSRTIRRTVLRHALLSYVFGAVIVALTINILATTIS